MHAILHMPRSLPGFVGIDLSGDISYQTGLDRANDHPCCNDFVVG